MKRTSGSNTMIAQFDEFGSNALGVVGQNWVLMLGLL